MKKTYVLDTSVLAYDNNCFSTLRNSDVIIPIVVLEELDKLKSYSSSVGKNARVFTRKLDEMLDGKDVTKPIKIANNITLFVDTVARKAIGQDANYGDNQILACAAFHNKKNKNTVVVSRDVNLRIRARSYGIGAETYEKNSIETDEIYSGIRTIKNEVAGNVLKQTGCLDFAEYKLEILPNECVSFINNKNEFVISGKRFGDKIRLVGSVPAWGIEPRSQEQAFAMNMLLDTKIPLVTMIGRAGCGKTLLAIAAALELAIQRKKYSKVIIYKPIVSVGREIGFLPGSKDEKILPYMGSIFDAFEVCLTQKEHRDKEKDRWMMMLDMWREKGIIELEALQYIRGRSMPNVLLLLDESQNCSVDELKTLITRVGAGSKIVMIGDVDQIDAQNLDSVSNGLTQVVEKFKSSELSAHITLTNCERSQLAEEAANLL